MLSYFIANGLAGFVLLRCNLCTLGRTKYYCILGVLNTGKQTYEHFQHHPAKTGGIYKEILY